MDEPRANSARATYDELSRRCAALGVPLWHCDASGTVLAAPLAAAPIPSGAVEQAAHTLFQTADLAPQQISPQTWLIPLEDRQGTRRIALNLALVKADDPEQLRRTQMILGWSFDELARAERDGRTIEQFSEQLAQTYEETNLLYRMARLLNCANDPRQSVQTISEQLQEVLPFRWLAVRFSKHAHGVRDLAGQMILAGESPCDQGLIRQLSDPMLDRPSEAGWEKLLDPHRDALAAAAGTEVLAEPITHDGRVIGLLLAGGKSGPDPALSSFEIQFLDATADFLGVFHENLARFAEQQEMFIGTLRALTASIDAKDRYTCGHSERVGLMASKMAAAMGMSNQLVEQYRIAGLVHDVGKIGVSEAVLAKPGKLTNEEFDQIKLHPEIGHNILKDIPVLEPVLPGVLSHHERWDGRGYPHKIAGEAIPMIARVLALADTFDAMSSNRSYRPALPRDKVLEEIARCAGTQFDPELAPVFVKLDFSEFDQALEAHRTLEQRAA